MSFPSDFAEIGHTGGKATIAVFTHDNHRRYQISYEHSSPNRVVLLEFAISIDGERVTALGYNEPPPPGWSQVHLASDNEGRFGHHCPSCAQYWRSDAYPTTCPYCRFQGNGLQFLSNAQWIYLRQYCQKLRDALNAEEDGVYSIDMDAVADAAGTTAEKPPFYYAEESQQNKFECRSCGAFNDILGTYAYCASCATRNDLQEMEMRAFPKIRERINSGGPYEDCVKDTVAAFDSFVGQYVEQFLRLVPMTPARKAYFERRRFHNLRKVLEDLKNVFDIDISGGMKSEDIDFAELLFHRRHVYEHKGGEADQKYIDNSGDKSVRLKQALRETQESAHRLVGLVAKMASSLHGGFHEIFPPDKRRIEAYLKQQRNG